MDDLKRLMLGPPARTLAVAESVTCGRIQAKVGEISGASNFFLGGITAYTLEEKVRHLGVDRAGAHPVDSVSAAVAEQMARGVCALFGAEIGVATTGYAEPSAERQVKVPFGWWAVARRGADGTAQMRSGRTECPGAGRVAAQDRIAEAALAALRDWLSS